MTFRDTLLALSVPLFWGLGITFAKVAITEFPPILLMTLRFALAAAVLVWFVPVPRHLMRQIFWIALVSAAIQYSLTFYGVKLLDASTAALVIQLEVPFLVIMGAVVFNETVGLKRTIGIVISIVGVVAIAGEPRLDNNLDGIFLCAGGAFAWAVGQVMIRKLGVVSGLMLIAWVAVFATPQLFAISLVVEGNPLPAIIAASWKVWVVLAYLGLIMTALAYAVWYNLIGRLAFSRVAPMLLLLPVVSVSGSVLLLGETLTWWLAGGGIAILFGVGLIVFENTRDTPDTPKP